MKRKTIYALIVICFLGLISSANQSNKECGKTSICLSEEKTSCCQKTKALPETEKKADAASVPLNLFLFEL